MTIANRIKVLQPEKAFTVLEKARELEAQGKSIIHLEIGEPEYSTAKHIKEALCEAVWGGKTRYTPTMGIPELRKEIAKQYPTDYKNVAVVPSTKLALFCALAAIVNPGDEVIYPDPGFTAYKNVIEFFGGIAKPVPLIESRGFGFDMDALKGMLNEKTKAIILCFPSNPTGTLLPKEDLEFLEKETSCYLISDETYKKILFTQEPYVSPYDLPGSKERTIICDGFSKAYSMTGYRIGWMVVPEHLRVATELLINNTVSCAPEFIQYAALEALQGLQRSVTDMVKDLKDRRDGVVIALNNMKEVSCMVPHGAFYVFPNIKKTGMSSVECAEYLLDNGVAVLDGTAFGEYGEGYLRLSYAGDMGELNEGMLRMREAFNKL